MAINGVDFNNLVFRNRLLTDKILSGRYKVALNTLFTNIKRPDQGGSWMDFGIVENFADFDKIKPNNMWTSAPNYPGKKDAIKYNLALYNLMRGIPTVANMEDHILLENQNAVFKVLSEVIYEKIFKDALAAINKDTVKVENKKIDAKIIDTMLEEAGKLSIRANQIVFSDKVASKIFAQKEVKENLQIYKIGHLAFEKLESILGVKVISLVDPRDLLKDRIIIMYKGVEGIDSETALVNFVYHGAEGFYEGEFARVFDEVKPGIKGITTCHLSVMCDPKLADKNLIKILNIT